MMLTQHFALLHVGKDLRGHKYIHHVTSNGKADLDKIESLWRLT